MNWAPEVQRASSEGQSWLASPIRSVYVHVNSHIPLAEFSLWQYHAKRTVCSRRQGYTCFICSYSTEVRVTREYICVPWQRSQKAVPYQELHFLGPLHLWHLQMMGNKNADYSDPSNSKFEKIYYRCDLGYSQSFALISKSTYLTSYWGKT